jgi:hypothetical protein
MISSQPVAGGNVSEGDDEERQPRHDHGRVEHFYSPGRQIAGFVRS